MGRTLVILCHYWVDCVFGFVFVSIFAEGWGAQRAPQPSANNTNNTNNTNRRNKKYIKNKIWQNRIEIRIHTAKIHLLAVIHSEEDGVRIHDDFEDKDMLKNVGISSQRSINDTGTGQQCLVWRKMSGGILISRQTILYVSYVCMFHMYVST